MFDELYPWPNNPKPALSVVYGWATGTSEVPLKELFHAGWDLAGCVGGVIDPHAPVRALKGPPAAFGTADECKAKLAEECKKALDALAPQGPGAGAVDWLLILQILRTLFDLLTD